MAQFPDGPVEWPWCIQLVHGAHSSLRSHWCLVAFPGTRINAAPLGGQKWERVSNSERRKARESQGMTIDGKPSTTTTAAFTSRLRGWLSPGQPPFPPRLPLQTQGVQDEQKTKPHEHLNPLPSSRRESRGEKFKRARGVSYPKRKSGTGERRARGMQVGGRRRKRGRMRRDGDARERSSGEESRAVQRAAHRKEERKAGRAQSASTEQPDRQRLRFEGCAHAGVSEMRGRRKGKVEG